MLSAALLFTLRALLPADAGQPAETARSRPITITAIVTDRRGAPVADLARADFTLHDEGTPRPIEAVEFKRAGGRLFALFFDEYHVEAGDNTARARQALAQLIDEQAREGDRFVAMKPLDQISAIQATSDRQLVRQTVEAFAGCKEDYSPRSAFEAEYMSRAPQAASLERSRVVRAALSALAVQLGGVRDVPKAIVLVTEGMDGAWTPVVRAANRAGISIYVVDPREGPREADADAALRSLARDTGGSVISGSDTLGRAVSDVARDLDGYYLLTYRPGAAPDGTFHTIDIGTKRPGTRVRAQRGYWSPAPGLQRAIGPAPSFPIDELLAAHASNLIRPWFRLSRGPEGRTRITFSWERNAVVAKANAGSPEVLQLTAQTPDGNAIFRGTVAMSAAPSTAPDAAPTRAVIDAPPGRLRLEMNITDAQSRLLDRDIRFMEIPNLYVPGVIIMAPEIVRTRTARQFRELAGDADAYPTSSREFNRFERLLIRVRAYGPGEAPPHVTATLVNAIGQRLYAIQRAQETLDGLMQFDLPLSVLARGAYSIEIGAGEGQLRTSQMVSFRVIG
jgi:VWFA-related protein